MEVVIRGIKKNNKPYESIEDAEDENALRKKINTIKLLKPFFKNVKIYADKKLVYDSSK